ncbi:MAG: hypothetical protein F6K31_07050 [Symploca sp. SIO2G7]|nr:hypothetical protein [Symploca sp. SIO2G7]
MEITKEKRKMVIPLPHLHLYLNLSPMLNTYHNRALGLILPSPTYLQCVVS